MKCDRIHCASGGTGNADLTKDDGGTERACHGDSPDDDPGVDERDADDDDEDGEEEVDRTCR